MMLATWLEDPYIRRILPAIVRRPLDVPPQGSPLVTHTTTIDATDDLTPVFDTYAIARFKAVGSFESKPIACQQFHHLRFEVFSSSSWSGLKLAVHDLRADRDTNLGMPWDRTAGWNPIVVRCPDGPFTIRASDDSQQAWLAVRPPTEMAWASTIAAWMIQQARFIGLFALGICGVAIGSSIANLRRALGQPRAQPS